MLYKFLLCYLVLISIVSAIVTICDKLYAIAGKRRVPEKTLLALSVFGGSVSMLITMLIIRHKTRKPKFMIGIPLIILLQFIITLVVMVNI